MENEFNLSNKIGNADDGYDTGEGTKIILAKDVKEFIKILKLKVNGLDFFMSGSKIRFDDWLKGEIDKLAGDDLK